MSNAPSPPAATSCSRSWSVSEDSLRRYVNYASERCIQELLSASESSDGWKVLTFRNGVEISRRSSASLHVFRSRWLLRSVSPQQFFMVANAIDAAKQWDPDLVEAKHIKDLNDNLRIIALRFGDASKPLFKKREFVVYERRESLDDGTLVVAVASLPHEIAAGLQPKNGNAIRGLLLQSGWVVEKLEDDSCVVTYVVQVVAQESFTLVSKVSTRSAASHRSLLTKVSSFTTTNENAGVSIRSYEVPSNSSTDGTETSVPPKSGSLSLDALAKAKRALQLQKELSEKQ